MIVSHSAKLGEGLVELLHQLTAGKIHIVSASGAGGQLGTNPLAIVEALNACPENQEIAAFCDLGSALLSYDMARELLPEATQSRVTLVDAPLVEGAIAAAMEASLGGSMDKVVHSALAARDLRKAARS